MEDIIVGLDIGTTKICAVVGERTGNTINIIGTGSHPSVGLKKGVVIDIDSTVDSIKKAIEEAELMAGCEISTVYVGIAGGHIMGFNSHGIISVKGREVTQSDVDRVIEAARALAIPMDREVIHVLPQEFIVDGQRGLKNPIGMAGIRLEANIHIVTGAVASANNIIKCVNKAGLDVADVVLEPLASGEAVLHDEEKEIGTALIDIGGGTTDLAIFTNNTIRHTFVLAIGGHQLTNDISVGLRATQANAEAIKIQYGCCTPDVINASDVFEIPGIGGRGPSAMSRQVLGEILEPRVEEIFTLIKREIFKIGLENSIPAGIVVTGGSSQLEGLTDVAESIFNMPTRLGSPKGIGGLVDVVNNPTFATGVGLVLYGAKNTSEKKFRIRDDNIFNRLIKRMKKWFSDVV
jgi:cell division protein FtsA